MLIQLYHIALSNFIVEHTSIVVGSHNNNNNKHHHEYIIMIRFLFKMIPISRRKSVKVPCGGAISSKFKN